MQTIIKITLIRNYNDYIRTPSKIISSILLLENAIIDEIFVDMDDMFIEKFIPILEHLIYLKKYHGCTNCCQLLAISFFKLKLLFYIVHWLFIDLSIAIDSLRLYTYGSTFKNNLSHFLFENYNCFKWIIKNYL